MSETCKECGYEVHDGAQVCPNCGSPMGEESVSDYMDDEVLAQGMSTDAESTISIYAKIILYWGRFVAVVIGIGTLILMIATMRDTIDHVHNDVAKFFLGLWAFVFPVILGLIIWGLAKLLWAAIMIYVNISTTLKRIEIKLEKYGTK